jgi:hypothetical protein
MEEAILKLTNEIKHDRSVKVKMFGVAVLCLYLYKRSFKKMVNPITVKVVNDVERAQAVAYAKYYETYSKALMKLFEDGVDDVDQEALDAYHSEIEFLDLMFQNEIN